MVPQPKTEVTVTAATPRAGAAQAVQTDSGPPLTPSPRRASGSVSDDGSVFSHQIEHPGVVCDNCELGIVGFRYKCLKCADYDLCSTCERRGLHAGHIMMRIPFPELAAEAIKRHIGPVSPEPTFPFGHMYEHEQARRVGHEHRGEHGHGHGQRRRHSQSHSSPESADEAKHPVPPLGWCPYQLGRKEWKKLAKTVKKTAQQHKRTAEACLRNASEGLGSNPSAQTQTGGTAPPTSMDFAATAVQIQEVLNAFGLPIDVVRLYESWGAGAGTTATTASESTNAAAGADQQNAASGSATTEHSQAEVATAYSLVATQDEVMREQFQDLNIRSEVPLNLSRDVSDSGSAHSGALSEDLIHLSENISSRSSEAGGDSEWTMVEGQSDSHGPSRNSLPGDGAATVGGVPAEVMIDTKVFRQIPITTEVKVVPSHIEAQGPAVGQPVSVPAPMIASPPRSMIASPPRSMIVPPPVIPSPPAPITTSPSKMVPVTPPRAPQQQPHTSQAQGIYQQLPQALAPLVSGITTAVGNVTRNIPIALNRQQPARGPQSPPARPPLPTPVLDEQKHQVLLQLLNMGFSNHNDNLAHLVIEKNGNMEDILNALFPRPR